MGDADEIASDDGRRRHRGAGDGRGSLLLVGGAAVVAAGVLVGMLTLPGRATTSGSGSPTASPVAVPGVAAPTPSFTAADGSEYLVVVPGMEPHVLDGDDLARWTAQWVATALPPEAQVDVAGARLADDPIDDDSDDGVVDDEAGDAGARSEAEDVVAYGGTVITSVSIAGQRRPMVLSLGLSDRSRVCAPPQLDPATPCTSPGKPAGRSAWTASFGAAEVSHAWLVPEDSESPVPLVRAVSAGIGEVPAQAAGLARDWVKAAAEVMARRIWDVPLIGDPDYYADLEAQDLPMPTPTPRPELLPRLAAWEDRVRALLPTVAERLGWTLDAEASLVHLTEPFVCDPVPGEDPCVGWTSSRVEVVASDPARLRWVAQLSRPALVPAVGWGQCPQDGPSGWPDPMRIDSEDEFMGRCVLPSGDEVYANTVGRTTRFGSDAGFLAVPAGTDPGIGPAELEAAVRPIHRVLDEALAALTSPEPQD